MADESNKNPVQPMTKDDIDRVCDIWLIGSLTSHGFIYPGFWHSRLPGIKEHFEDTIRCKDNYEAYVYKEVAGTIKGFVILKCKNDHGQQVSYMEELFIDLPYQRKGIGTRLLRDVRENKKFVETSVYQLNTDAVIFYAKNGFKIKREQEGAVYVEPETGQWKLRMRWDECREEHSAIYDDE